MSWGRRQLNADGEQVRRAVRWVRRNAQSFGGDPNVSTFRAILGRALAGVILTTTG